MFCRHCTDPGKAEEKEMCVKRSNSSSYGFAAVSVKTLMVAAHFSISLSHVQQLDGESQYPRYFSYCFLATSSGVSPSEFFAVGSAPCFNRSFAAAAVGDAGVAPGFKIHLREMTFSDEFL